MNQKSEIVKIIKYFKSKVLAPIYTKTESNSKDQFEHDFGCYPPIALQATVPTTKFSIIQLNTLGFIIHKISLIYKLQTRKFESIDEELRVSEWLTTLQEQNTKAMESLRSLKNEFESQSTINKILTTTLISLISPAIILALAAYLTYYFFKLTLAALKEDKLRGVFMPVIHDDLEILVFGRNDDKNKLDAVKSHEHIHLVQYTHRMEPGGKFKIALKNPEEILTQECAKSKYINYLFEKEELEARLHEFVLSFYRTHRLLPLSKNEFINLISTANKISPLVCEILLENAAPFDKTEESTETYPVRDFQSEREIAIILLSIKNKELQRRFILEALTVMYGNLLGYYGDQGAKERFLAEIKRPNLYDSHWT